ncbi:DUF5000 domain-containing lipoprotein [Chitinophaga horti]|uniref:DUF5000 domain-containing lipoprotein n=1 Tax=Chitinophaga horti TaxID=2920382 RepID=A0ABY6IYN0_9BACT|nr:DUF5000 domain-containing lipoprotein [Chitinophaga horti]UYQ92496.1 DUF5000 domain-containing lipoprotein [Chitinophaga horti]
MQSKYWLILFAAFLFACKEETLEPLNEGGDAPQLVSDVKAVGFAGKVELTYALPKDPNLFYVKAEYEIRPGKKMEAIATYYNNTLTLEGFGDTTERTVKLYSVSRSEVKSAPVAVKVKPLQPPVKKTFASLHFDADFGGISVSFLNEDSANVVIGVLTKDSLGAVVPADMYYTSQKKGTFSARGFDAKPRWFGVYVRDRWTNLSDTSWKQLTPMHEQMLNKSLFRAMKLAGDANLHGNMQMSTLWNNVITGGSATLLSWLRTANGSGVPHMITFDLGVKAKLSRFQFIPRGAIDEQNLLYAAGDPRLFEIWGTNEPSADGSLTSWTKLSDCEVIKPSGLPIGTQSNDDILAAQAGREFKMPLDIPAVRYIRLRILQTWGNSDYMWMAEATLYGEIQ